MMIALLKKHAIDTVRFRAGYRNTAEKDTARSLGAVGMSVFTRRKRFDACNSFVNLHNNRVSNRIIVRLVV